MPKALTNNSEGLNLDHVLMIIFGLVMFTLAVLGIVLLFNHPKEWVRQKVGSIAAFCRRGMSILFETASSNPCAPAPAQPNERWHSV
jgi:hypothetical protein